MAELQLREALRRAMVEEMRRDEDVFLMGEEVAYSDGAYKVSQGMLAEFGDKRIIDTSVGGDTSTNVLIGETITYELVMDLTEGTTEDVVLVDRTRFANSANDPVGGALEILSAEILALGCRGPKPVVLINILSPFPLSTTLVSPVMI